MSGKGDVYPTTRRPSRLPLHIWSWPTSSDPNCVFFQHGGRGIFKRRSDVARASRTYGRQQGGGISVKSTYLLQLVMEPPVGVG